MAKRHNKVTRSYKIVSKKVRAPGAPRFEASASVSPLSKRLVLLNAHRDHILKMWDTAPLDMPDPIVIIAKQADAVGRMFFKGRQRGDVAVALTSAAQLLASTNIEQAACEGFGAELRSLRTGKLFASIFAYDGTTAGYLGIRASTGQFEVGVDADEALGRGSSTVIELIRKDIAKRNDMARAHAEDIATVGVAMMDAGLPCPVVVVGELSRFGLSEEPGIKVLGMSLHRALDALEIDDDTTADIEQAPLDWVKVLTIGDLGTTATALTGRGTAVMLGVQ